MERKLKSTDTKFCTSTTFTCTLILWLFCQYCCKT